MANWTFTKDAVVVELPSDPSSVIDDNPAMSTSVGAGTLIMIIGRGKKPRRLTISGRLYDASKTKAQLYTDYCDKLIAMGNKVVTLSNTTFYDGDWYMENPKFEHEPGYTKSLKYNIVLLQGTQYVVI
jgi:hypothetical protein